MKKITKKNLVYNRPPSDVIARLTPGDWGAVRCSDGCTPVINSYTGRSFSDIEPLATIDTDNLANACMMAASKKLYSALDNIMHWFTHTTQGVDQATDEMPADLFDAAVEALSAAIQYHDGNDPASTTKTMSATTTDTNEED